MCFVFSTVLDVPLSDKVENCVLPWSLTYLEHFGYR